MQRIEQAYGVSSPELYAVLDRSARLARREGRLDEAEGHWQRALHLNVEARGPSHPYVAAILLELGRLRDGQGRCTEAEMDFGRALEITEACDPPDAREVARAVRCLVTHYQQRGEPERADAVRKRG